VDSDQRKSFRILMPDGQEMGVLRAGRREVKVRIVDASAGGFALASNTILPVRRGDLLRLRTSAGWHEVRVARQESYTDGVFLGVERVSDIDDPREMQRVKSGWLDYIFLPYAQGSVSGTKAAGLFTSGALAGIVLAGFVTLLVNYSPPKKDATLLPSGADEVVSTLATQARKVAQSIRSEPAAQPASRPAGNSKSLQGLDALFHQASGSSEGLSADLGNCWQQSADAIASRLGLTSDQRGKIDSILSNSPPASDQGERAKARILDILTPEQAKTLEGLAN
jgi:hypothetical protein